MHRATGRFWKSYRRLPAEVRQRADRAFALLLINPAHPSLAFKKVGSFRSVRIGLKHRALGVADGEDTIWVWVGTHGEYDRLVEPL